MKLYCTLSLNWSNIITTGQVFSRQGSVFKAIHVVGHCPCNLVTLLGNIVLIVFNLKPSAINTFTFVTVVELIYVGVWGWLLDNISHFSIKT